MPNSMGRSVGYAVLWLAVILGLVHFVGFAGYGSKWALQVKDHLAGFGVGLAHGFLSVIALVTSFFNRSVNIYEINNTGIGYNIGFVLGACFWFLSPRFIRKNDLK